MCQRDEERGDLVKFLKTYLWLACAFIILFVILPADQYHHPVPLISFDSSEGCRVYCFHGASVYLSISWSYSQIRVVVIILLCSLHRRL